MHVPKFTYRYARFACRRTRGKVIVDNGSCFLKTQKLALPLGREEGNKRKKKKEIPSDASTTMIITSCSFHGTAHDYPKISVCNGISSSLFSVAIPSANLSSALLLFRLSSFGHLDKEPLTIFRSRESRCIF